MTKTPFDLWRGSVTPLPSPPYFPLPPRLFVTFLSLIFGFWVFGPFSVVLLWAFELLPLEINAYSIILLTCLVAFITYMYT